MDKYRKARRTPDPIKENEIRITAVGKGPNYMIYATGLLEKMDSIVIKATGNVIPRAVILAEKLKRKVEGLHQITKIGTAVIVDVYEPLEEGLDRVSDERAVSCIEITLSLKELDVHNIGYQPPLVIPQKDSSNQATDEDLEKRPQGNMYGRGRRGEGYGRGAPRGDGYRNFRQSQNADGQYGPPAGSYSSWNYSVPARGGASRGNAPRGNARQYPPEADNFNSFRGRGGGYKGRGGYRGGGYAEPFRGGRWRGGGRTVE